MAINAKMSKTVVIVCKVRLFYFDCKQKKRTMQHAAADANALAPFTCLTLFALCLKKHKQDHMTVCVTCGFSTGDCVCREDTEQQSLATIAKLQAEIKSLKAERDRLAAENAALRKQQQQQQGKSEKSAARPTLSPFSAKTVLPGQRASTTAAKIARLSNSSVYIPMQRNDGATAYKSNNQKNGITSTKVVRSRLVTRSTLSFGAKQ